MLITHITQYYTAIIYLQKVNTQDHDNKSPEHVHHKDPKVVEKEFFRLLPKSMIMELYEKIYKIDFEMLGYSYPQEQIDMGYN